MPQLTQASALGSRPERFSLLRLHYFVEPFTSLRLVTAGSSQNRTARATESSERHGGRRASLSLDDWLNGRGAKRMRLAWKFVAFRRQQSLPERSRHPGRLGLWPEILRHYAPQNDGLPLQREVRPPAPPAEQPDPLLCAFQGILVGITTQDAIQVLDATEVGTYRDVRSSTPDLLPSSSPPHRSAPRIGRSFRPDLPP
jgi:hypothetical protein